MHPDPILCEVLRIRKEHESKYGNDLDRIVEALRAEERKSDRAFLNPGPRRLTVEHVSEDRAPYQPPEEGAE